MTSNIMDDDKVVTVGLPAWHKLGQNFQLPISAEDAHTSMGGSFTLCKKQVGVMFDKSFVKIPNSYAIVRGPTNKDATSKVFGYATDHYHLIQPIEIIKKFDEKVGIGIETLGFIEDGKKCFLTWKLPEFDVSDGDEVKLYGILMLGFDTIFSSRLNVGTVRVVCANTFAAALGEEKEEMKKNRGRGANRVNAGGPTTAMIDELGENMEITEEDINAVLGANDAPVEESLTQTLGNMKKVPSTSIPSVQYKGTGAVNKMRSGLQKKPKKKSLKRKGKTTTMTTWI